VLLQRSLLVERAVADAAALVDGIDCTHVLIAARGSSKNAARFAQYVWGSEAGLLVNVARPLLFQGVRSPKLPGAVVIGISQSGESPDIVNVLSLAAGQGRPTLCLTNNEDSPMATAAGVVVPLHAGIEAAVPSTKTFLASLQTEMQILRVLRPDPVLSSYVDQIPQCVSDAITSAFEQRDAFSRLQDLDSLIVLGRGAGYAAASEIALKLREVTGIRAESFSAPEFLHGPIAACGEGSSIWVVASPDQPVSYWAQLVEQLKQRGCIVTTLQSTSATLLSTLTIELPDDLPAWLFAILASVFGQVAALLIGEALGLNVDSPTGLRKITLTK
jgi:glucosamine--fructose-6-phosphate aminotransferase (isomerizing)